MAITTTVFTLTGNTRQEVSPESVQRRGVQIKVNTSGKTVYIGGPAVTATGATKGIAVSDTDPWWGIYTDQAVNVMPGTGDTTDITVLVAPS